MQDFSGKTAVVSGVGGIGAALARRCAAEGMALVLADLNEDTLQATAAALRSEGARVLAQPTDVGDGAQVEALADAADRQFGAVHLLFNNAGVIVDGLSWERSEEDWQWIFQVNVFGVIHGLRAFVPRMLAHGESGHIVNTASMAGLVAGPFLAPYTATKHAIVGISETLYHELQMQGGQLGASVLCPGAVRNTALWSSATVRPSRFGALTPLASESEKGFRSALQQAMSAGMTPDDFAAKVFQGVRERRFWLMTDDEYREPLQRRFSSIMESGSPDSML